MLIWQEKFSTKNVELDNQHCELFVIVNDILELMKTEKANDTIFISGILNRLYEYTQYHFQVEEKKFAMTQYPQRGEHIKAHRDFTEKVKQMIADKGKMIPALHAINIAQAANQWIIEHVINFDKGYSQYIQ